jgi:hypothetical protein
MVWCSPLDVLEDMQEESNPDAKARQQKKRQSSSSRLMPPSTNPQNIPRTPSASSFRTHKSAAPAASMQDVDAEVRFGVLCPGACVGLHQGGVPGFTPRQGVNDRFDSRDRAGTRPLDGRSENIVRLDGPSPLSMRPCTMPATGKPLPT